MTQREAYEAYLESSHWKALREQALIRAGRKCEFCQKTKTLDGHHLQYRNYTNCTVDDVMILCRKHHDEWHARHSSHVIATREQVIVFLKATKVKPVKLKQPKTDTVKLARKAYRKQFKAATNAIGQFLQSKRTRQNFKTMMDKLAQWGADFYLEVEAPKAVAKELPTIPESCVLPCNAETVTVTKEHLKRALSVTGGLTKKKLAVFGIEWPPRHGWKKQAIGKVLNAQELAALFQPST